MIDDERAVAPRALGVDLAEAADDDHLVRGGQGSPLRQRGAVGGFAQLAGL
jgi:hypothetical protein